MTSCQKIKHEVDIGLHEKNKQFEEMYIDKYIEHSNLYKNLPRFWNSKFTRKYGLNIPSQNSIKD